MIFRLMRGRGHRCDQWAAEADGEVVAQAAGITELHDILRARWHKAPSLRMLATA